MKDMKFRKAVKKKNNNIRADGNATELGEEEEEDNDS